MKESAFVRKLMIAAGMLAAFTILFSPAFKSEASRVIKEVSAAADDTTGDQTKLVSVSPDAVTSPQAVEVESANPYVVQEVITGQEQTSLTPARILVMPVALITSLLRMVISPQAP